MTATLEYMAVLSRAIPACAACLGDTDSTQVAGMNSAILFLMGVVLCVLALVVYVGFRIALLDAGAAAHAVDKSTNNITPLIPVDPS